MRERRDGEMRERRDERGEREKEDYIHAVFLSGFYARGANERS